MFPNKSEAAATVLWSGAHYLPICTSYQAGEPSLLKRAKKAVADEDGEAAKDAEATAKKATGFQNTQIGQRTSEPTHAVVLA